MSNEPAGLRPLLAQLYAAKWGDEDLSGFTNLQERFVFHMADAAEEIHLLSHLLDSELAPEVDQAAVVLTRFFLHAVPHLVAAGQLYDYIPEIFPEQKGVHTLPGSDPSGRQPGSLDSGDASG
ncbi:hypothetical protein [Paludisphaera rhizosphaerae]|uniref:hypothetical protein n=1 Tax=Paludisphaera rhizosphaerae TaxID=2711216 RepID=UPI0013ECA13F|nr:hypothetical protein [Paludisphaera rhizosphaerae]